MIFWHWFVIVPQSFFSIEKKIKFGLNKPISNIVMSNFLQNANHHYEITFD